MATVRSISLPSRIHPASVNLQAALDHMKSSCTDTTSLQLGLVALADVYTCAQDLLRSSENQQTLRSSGEAAQTVEELLEESVILLDTCDVARNSVSKMEEHLQAVQSALRRSRGDEAVFKAEVAAYVRFRRKTKRDLKNSLLQLKRLETKYGQTLSVDRNDLVKLLRRACTVSVSFFKSLLMFLSVSSAMKDRSVMAKMIRVRLLLSSSSSSNHHKGMKGLNEIESVDAALWNLKNKVELQTVQKMSEALSVNLHEIDAGLDSLFLCLVQCRVLLLNIITPL